MNILSTLLNYEPQNDVQSHFQNGIPTTGSYEQDEANVLQTEKEHVYY
jgi:hypothetical protein